MFSVMIGISESRMTAPVKEKMMKLFLDGFRMTFQITTWMALSVGFCCISIPVAWGWGNLGHEVSGEITEKNLTPKAKAWISAILGPEPLAVASSWADTVRGDSRFQKFAPYHYVNLWDPSSPLSLLQGKKNAVNFLLQAPRMLLGDTASRDQKMVLLRYFVHIFQDIHQPLHVDSNADMGATLCSIRWGRPNSKPKEDRLHTFWDVGVIDVLKEKVPGPPHWITYPELTEVVLKRTPSEKIPPAEAFQAAKFEKDLISWIREAHDLLPTQIYPPPPRGNKDAKSSPHPYCKRVDVESGKVLEDTFDPRRIPLLTEDYIQRSVVVAQEQLYKGGIRLAAVLNALAEKTSTTVRPGSESPLLDSLFPN